MIAQLLLAEMIGGAESLAASLDSVFNHTGHSAVLRYLDQSPHHRTRIGRLQVVRALRASSPSAVLAHSALPILYAAAGLGSATPLVAVLHSAGDDYASARLRYAHHAALRYVDHVVAVSEQQAEVYLRHFRRDRTPLSVIENGIDTERFLPLHGGEAGSPTAPTRSTLRMLSATRLVSWKRVDLSLAATAILKARGLDASLTVLGGGESGYVSQLHSRANALGLEEPDCNFLGPRSDVASIMREHDVLVHCSSQEGFSVALVEAAACGLPLVLSSSLTSAPQGAVIRRFKDGSAVDLADVLETVLASKATLGATARMASKDVRRHYSIARTAERYLEVVDRARVHHRL